MIPLPLALALAFGFGVVYNWLVARWEAAGDSGATALWVVFGVLVTLLLAALPSTPASRYMLIWAGSAITLTNAQHASLHCFWFFAATGTPMVAGSLWRYIQRNT